MISIFIILFFSNKYLDVLNLEELIRQNIVSGHPKTKKPWEKIFIITEGIFSMEGSIVNLPGIIAIKKKYKVCIINNY